MNEIKFVLKNKNSQFFASLGWSVLMCH